MAANTPRFGPKLNLDEHGYHMENFEAEMYRFTDGSRESARYVNVLHLGTDMGAARPEMDRMVGRMGEWGYAAEREPGLSLSNDGEMLLAGMDTDMLVVGSDDARYESARYVLWCVGVGWFGIVPYWDVLWYGTDRVPEPYAGMARPYPGMANAPLCSGHKFAQDGICLAHAHIRRRDNDTAVRGEYIAMLREIEGRINEMVKGAWRKTAYEKFDALKAKVKEDGHVGVDVELLFAALDILRHSRNVGVHMVRGLPPAEIKKEIERSDGTLSAFDRLANRHNRPLWPPVASSRADSYVATKFEYRTAHMVVTWLDEYSKLSADT